MENSSSNQKKRFKILGRFNIFDVIVAIGCVVLVYGVYLFAMPQQAIAETGRLVRFTIEFAEREAGFYQRVQPGPLVFEGGHDTAIGAVVYAYSLPFLQDVPDEENSIIRRSPVEGREFTYIVVETWANVCDFQIEVNQFRIAVNRDIYVRSRDFAGRGFITGVEIVN